MQLYNFNWWEGSSLQLEGWKYNFNIDEIEPRMGSLVVSVIGDHIIIPGAFGKRLCAGDARIFAEEGTVVFLTVEYMGIPCRATLYRVEFADGGHRCKEIYTREYRGNNTVGEREADMRSIIQAECTL
jgi:hypothetical protein